MKRKTVLGVRRVLDLLVVVSMLLGFLSPSVVAASQPELALSLADVEGSRLSSSTIRLTPTATPTNIPTPTVIVTSTVTPTIVLPPTAIVTSTVTLTPTATPANKPTPPPPPVADFTAAPLTAAFTNTTTGGATGDL